LELARLVGSRTLAACSFADYFGDNRSSMAEIADHGHFLEKPYRPDEVIREIHELTRLTRA
jgi:hypothetical protein